MTASYKVRYVPGTGDKKGAWIMLVGEAPGAEEEEAGKPFVGPSGKLIDEALYELGWDRSDLYITNAVKVRPPENRPPTLDEVESWKPILFQEVKEVNPVLIITLGATALRAFNDNFRITKENGKVHDMKIEGHSTMLAPLFHPAYVLRGYHDRQKWIDTWKEVQYTSGLLLSSV